MVLFGKKKEEATPGMPPPDMGMPPGAAPAQDPYGQQYGAADQGYGQEAYPQQDPYSQGAQAPMEQQAAPPMAGGQAPPQPPAPELNKEGIEEVAEAIVEEKWAEKKKEIEKITEWKEGVTEKLSQLQQQINDLKGSFDSLHKGMLGKITEYDDNLTNVGTEIKAMGKVFSKVLPSLTDSVNKLQRYSGKAPSVVKRK